MEIGIVIKLLNRFRFQNNLKNLDNKTVPDHLGCFGRENLSLTTKEIQ